MVLNVTGYINNPDINALLEGTSLALTAYASERKPVSYDTIITLFTLLGWELQPGDIQEVRQFGNNQFGWRQNISEVNTKRVIGKIFFFSFTDPRIKESGVEFSESKPPGPEKSR